MISLLAPVALWLTPLLAAPLLIHLLGRARPRTRDFPSLLPVRGQLLRAMRRQRLRNWLQLVLRTLFLLCLLLAAAGPVWRGRTALAPPAEAGILLHNGIWASVPSEGGGTLGEVQEGLLRGLDSLVPGGVFAERMFPESAGAPVARFGSWAEGVSRLLRRSAHRPGAHLFLPVFDPRYPVDAAPLLNAWLADRPDARLILVDHTGARARLNAFSPVRADPAGDGLISLRAAVRSREPVLWQPLQGPTREAVRRGDTAEILLALPASGWILGSLALGSGGDAFAVASAPVAVRVPPPALLCHLGAPGGVAARAALGPGGSRLRVVSLGEADGRLESCDVIQVTGSRNADAALLGQSAALVRRGGTVLLGTGRSTDIALLNRNLLAPLGIGRLGELRAHDPLPARVEAEALARLGLRPESWGRPGSVSRHLAFRPDSGTSVLLSLSTPEARAPLLLHRAVGAGQLLLWTTDLEDPEWSDIGHGPWAVLLHQAFFARARPGEVEVRAADSDSGMPLRGGAEAPRVLDPDHRPAARAPEAAGGWRAGPFDRLGLHRIESEADTSWLAVRLAEALPADDRRGWRELEDALGSATAGKVLRLDASADWRSLYDGISLRTGLLILAALLLFAEGVVALRLSPSRA